MYSVKVKIHLDDEIIQNDFMNFENKDEAIRWGMIGNQQTPYYIEFFWETEIYYPF